MNKESKESISFQELLTIVANTELSKDKAVIKQLYAYTVTNDPAILKTLQEKVKSVALLEALNPYPFYIPTLDEVKAIATERSIILGKYGRSMNIPAIIDSELLKLHMAIFGRSGSGKTNLLMWIIAQCYLLGIFVTVFDREKKDFRHLAKMYPDIKVFQLEKDFKYNPLEIPQGVSSDQWVQTFCTIFCRENGLLDASEAFLIKAVKELYELYGVYDGKQTYPSLHDLYEYIKRIKCEGPESKRYKDRILNRLLALLITHPALYDCSIGFSIEELFKSTCVLELNGFTHKHASFLTNMFLFRIFNHRVANNIRGHGISNVCVFDEAKWLFPVSTPNQISIEGYSPISYLLAQMREFGLGMVVADQSLAVEEQLFVNTLIKMILPLGSGEDIEKASRVLALNKEQTEWINRLHPGEAICRLPYFPEPVIVQIPEFPLG